MKKTTLLVGTLLVSQLSYADWYFRGTPNGWAADALTDAGNNTYTTCETFGSGDGGGGPRFKIDRFGDWNEAYPTSDYTVNPNQSYDITFNSSTNAITATTVANCDDDTTGFASNFSTMNIRGTFNSWAAESMELVGDNHWQATISLDGQANQRFKFDVFGDWSQNYGDTNIDGTLEQSGGDITTSVVGDYEVDLYDNSMTYTMTKVGDIVVQDKWYFRGTANGWAATELEFISGTQYELEVTFNGEDSNARFKIDHHGDWTENYPAQDFVVEDFKTYVIGFDSSSKAITATEVIGEDTQAPVVIATPGAGTYQSRLDVTLNITDNQDDNPTLYYTVDGTVPTTNSQEYTGGTIPVEDVVPTGIDMTIRTLAVDASGNSDTDQFDYIIDASTPVSTDFREETIYFLLTARFYDGDESNNYYNRDRIEPGDPHWRGDFKGLIAQLDYIKELGFTAIWITPPVENRSGLDYHGYHAYDWFKIDPRLESAGATYQDFIDAAHTKGLKVVQDVVINHSSQYGIRNEVWIDHLPIKYYVEPGTEQGDIDNGPYQGNLGDYLSLNRDDNDNPVAPQWFRDRHNSDPEGIVPLVDPKTGETVPQAGYDANRFFGIDAQTLDPEWYHLDGFMAGGDWENPTALQNKHMAGDTIDLATENQNVKDYMNNAIKMYLDMGVDAIRLDTAKHVERDELLTYTQEWQAHKPGTFVFGEVLVKGLGFGSEIANDNGPAAIRPWWYTRTGADPSNPQGDSGLAVFDFPLFSTFRDNVTRGSLGGIGGALAMDWTYADPTELVTFFQNHDVGPDNDFKYRYGGEEANAALAYNLLWTIRGIPTLYYGEEIMFMAGAPQDIQSNNDTPAQTGRAYYGPELDNPATRNHRLFKHIQRLNQIRGSIPALQKGVMDKVNEWGSGMSFVRNYNNGESYAVVGLATGGGASINVGGIPNGTYRDAVTGNTINVTNGSISFGVAGNSIGVYVLNGPGKIGADGTYLR